MKAFVLAICLALTGAVSAQDCAHCGFPIQEEMGQKRLITVTTGGKTYPVRCVLCARDFAAQYPGSARIVAPTEDPKHPLILTSNDRGEWTANLPDARFLEVEGDHARCNRWSRAFSDQAAFDAYVAANPAYQGAKALTLADWSALEGKEVSMEGMSGMDHGAMQGRLGPWTMAKEGSGTSWLPEASPMFMRYLGKWQGYDVNLMGMVTANYADAGGKRGQGQFFSNSMPMLMARKATGKGITGLNLMLSADPLTNGQRGYPNLFQTGETAHGSPLVDRQHPHDLVSELTLSYSAPIGGGLRGFVYGGPVGEPALGGPMYLHRPSGMENPEAPIGHHWFDATHISWGVVTAGINTEKWQLEGSFFNGTEPDENRYAPDTIALNSAAGRLTFNPSDRLSLNLSYGYLKSPERTEPGEDAHRLTAAALWSQSFANGDHLALTATYGRNIKGHGHTGDAFAFEGTLFRGPNSLFARLERVDKDELVGVPDGSYRVHKLLFGGVRNLRQTGGFDVGLGAYAGVYQFPSELESAYGANPVTLGVFLRIRPARMMP